MIELLLLAVPGLATPPPLDSVVVLTQGAATCAGAFIDDTGRIATAYHCVAAGGPLRVETRDGRREVGHALSVDRRMDLAIVVVPALADSPWVPIREGQPELGEKVWAIGHPFGAKKQTGFLEGTLRWSVSEGIVSAVGPHALQITAPVNPGNSGGPVLDEAGRLVGVVSRRIPGDGLGFAGRADRLSDLLDDPRRPGMFGGTLGASMFASVWGGPGGTASLGMRAEASLRDHLFADVGLSTALDGRWLALQYGEVSWVGSEARVGLRQRAFWGTATTRLDGYLGLASVDSWRAATGFSVSADTSVGWIAGAALTFPGLGVGFDLGMVNVGAVWSPRVALALDLPGTVWVF